MELINEILPEVYRTAIGWTILHSIWQIVGISLVLYIVLHFLNHKSALIKYQLSFLSLLLIMMVSIVTFVIILSNAEHHPAEGTVLSSPTFSVHEINVSQSLYSPSIFSTLESYIPLMVNIWLVGAALFLFKLGNNFSAINSLKRSAKINVPDKWVQFVYQQKKNMKISCSISLLSNQSVHCPITFGTLKPIILIPASLIFHLTPAQLEAIITHELAHIKRNDYLHNIIQSAMEAIFFYHPCFWWINGYVREQRENACDDLAVQAGIDPKDLAYGLAEVLNHAQEPNPTMALAAGAHNHPTLSRIKRILGFENKTKKFPSLISYTMIFTLLISASLVLGANHVSIKEKDKFLTTQAHFTPNIPFHYPQLDQTDTLPAKKKVYIIDREVIINEETSDESQVKNKLIIINGDTQQVYLPNKPMMSFRVDSIMANFPRMKMDSVMISKFRNNAADTAILKKFRIYKFDTAIIDKDAIRKLERNAKEMEKYSQEMEAHIQLWTNKNQPKLEELQQRLKEKEVYLFDTHEKFSKEIEPHLKELEKKMEDWQKELAPKMEELQKKMEIWQKENAKQLEELHKAIQESVKKGDN